MDDAGLTSPRADGADGSECARPCGGAGAAASAVADGFFHALADALPSMAFAADAQGARLWSGGAWVRYTGRTAAQLAGDGWRPVVHAEDLDATRAPRLRSLRSGTGFAARQRLRRHDGCWRWHLVQLAPMHDAAGTVTGWAGSATDIDDMVRAEQALAEQEQRARFMLALHERLRGLAKPRALMDAATAALGQALGVAQVGYGEIDARQQHITVHQDWNDGRIPSVVGTWRLEDFGPAVVADIRAGRTAAIADVTQDARTADPAVAAAYAGIHTRSILDVPLVKQDRLVALIFIHHPAPRAWTAAEVALVEQACEQLWSAVERARAERAREASEARLHAVLDALPVGVVLADAQGRLLRDNAAHRALWGVCPETGHWQEYGAWVGWRPDSGERIQAHEWAMARSLLHGEVVRGELVECQPFDGGPRRCYLNNSAPVRDAQGRLIGGVVVELDVTAQRAAALERERLLAAERLARGHVEQLQALTAALSAAHTPQEVALATLRTGVRALGAERGSVYRIAEDEGIELVAATDGDDGGAHAWRHLPRDLPTPAGDAVTRGEPVVIGRAAELAARYPALRAAAACAALCGTAVFPLRLPGAGEGVRGFVRLDFAQDRDVSPEEVRFLDALAQLCAQALERARAYEAEQAARAQVEAMLAAISDAFFALDRQWRFTYVNDRAQDVLGVAREQLLGRVVWEAYAPAVGTMFEREYRRAMAQGVPVAFEAHYPPLGAWFEVRAYPGAQGLAVYFQDITARREAAERLRASEDLLQAIFDAAPVGLVFAEAPSGRLVKANRQVEEILGHPLLPSPDVQGYGAYAGFHGDGRRVEPHEYALARALAGEARPELELQYARPDGRRVWIRTLSTALHDEAGRITGALVAVHDVDHKRRALEALEERTQQLAQAQLRLDMALAAGRMGVWDWTLGTGQSHWNAQMYELLGLPVREDGVARADLFMTMVHPEDRPALDAALARALEERGAFEVEMRLLCADGCVRWLYGRGQVLCDEGGNVQRMVGVNMDITPQKAAQAALAEAVKAKDMLLYEVHHRVKNNLQIITSLLSLQLRTVRDADARRAIEEAGARVSVMARLHLALYQSGRHGALDLAPWLQRLARDTLRLLGGGRRIALDFEGEEGLALEVDQAVPLSMAVSELLTNILKYAFPGGRAGTVTLRVQRLPALLRVLVADDGVGLPPGFDPAASTGLGMRIVHALVRQMDAQLTLQPQAAGAAFMIEVPVAAGPA